MTLSIRNLCACCCLAAFAWQRAGAQQANLLPDAPGMEQSSQGTGTLSGLVEDPAGALVQKAHITLSAEAANTARETVTDSNGRFTFSGVPAGTYDLTIKAEGFSEEILRITVTPGQATDLPPVSLQLAKATTQVNVTVPQQELAQYEVDAEIKQRVLGFIPNYYVTYVPHPVPLASRQKFQLAWRTAFDPVTIVFVGATAGVQQANNDLSGYGQGAAGYGKRYGADFADSFDDAMISGWILPSLLHQDPRYYYKGTGSIGSRILWVLRFSVEQKGDNGKWQPAYSGIGGGVAAGAISNLYYPAANRNGASTTFENAGIGIGLGIVGNMFQEFLIKRITPNAKKYAETDSH